MLEPGTVAAIKRLGGSFLIMLIKLIDYAVELNGLHVHDFNSLRGYRWVC